ncbi:hypothetical protein HCN44_010788 [Aphidius gifuensis]|uniref:EF-hand domain-containing protein n=1 Tax=Aphidius gifuensis TaxID=684658 RepID=A0A834XUR7_APHGI|nr:hypothetical protein HCN44_010788 [Aphidius gifuensis]
MAATAKHEMRQKFTDDNTGEEDIAAIAKQISDHAEAIYQTWKSRGLAPTEILNCHSNDTAVDKFGSALTPTIQLTKQQQQQQQQNFNNNSNIIEPLECLLNNNNNGNENDDDDVDEKNDLLNDDKNKLVKFVNNFVVEDRARQQKSSYLNKNLPSSIQFALEKFEKNTDIIKSQIKIRPKIKKSQSTLSNLSDKIDDIFIDKPKRPMSVLVGSPTKIITVDNINNNGGQRKINKCIKTGSIISEDTTLPIDNIIIKNKTRKTKPILIGTNGLISEQAVNFFNKKKQLEDKKNNQTTTTIDQVDNIQKIDTTQLPTTTTTTKWGPRINSPRTRLEQVPHPELTNQQKQHIRAAAAAAAANDTTNSSSTNINNPVRPLVTRGSVAERVLIFEKCPSDLLLDKRGPRQSSIGTNRLNNNTNTNNDSYVRERILQQQSRALPPHTTLQRHVKANKNVRIPRFYYPGGKPTSLSQLEATICKITKAFESLPGCRSTKSQFNIITKACDLPLYWKIPLFMACGGDKNSTIELTNFLDYWKELNKNSHDKASKFININTRGKSDKLLPEDLVCLVQDVVETHPGLTFLKEATEFHSRYVHTVIARIFYCVNRCWSGKISITEIRKSNILDIIDLLEHEEDINQVTSYFSYEHFYVIYCKFWELDRDHDLLIDKMDLTRHNDHALSTRLIERVFSGAVTRGGINGAQQHSDKMSYTEFVWFLLSEEDKNHPTAIEYWFRCMDLDGDGYLSMYELEYFYEEQLDRMEAIGMETLPFEDCLCQMLDMIHPSIPRKISLNHEQRDPFASTRDHDADGHELSDWDRFAGDDY